jgi:hypothetical protein
MPLSIIGAGQGRTGTLSLKVALERLGLGPCYHAVEIHHTPAWRLWLRALDHHPVDWEEIFTGYSATVDSPGCLFYAELADRYPEAKVILTLREPNSWYESAQGTYLSPANLRMFQEAPESLEIELARKELTVGFGTQLSDRAAVVAAFERHNVAVQRTIPPDRLLVYDVKHGWEPLCRFLGVTIPQSPFPHANVKKMESVPSPTRICPLP